MDLKDIKAIIDLMKKNSISEFELERGQEFKIKLKRGGAGPVQIIQSEESPTAFFSRCPPPPLRKSAPRRRLLPARWRSSRP